MSKNNIIAIVQARTGSTRLPGKILKKILDKPMLLLMLERLSTSHLIDKIVVATTTDKEDDVLENLSKSNGFNVFRGSVLDCLDRYYQTAKHYNAKIVLKITSDCPLIDPVIVDEVIQYFLDNENKFDYVSNVRPPTFPDGLDVEIFTFSVLEYAWNNATDPIHREHTTTFIHSQPEKFKIGNHFMPKNQNLFLSHRWTVDYLEDFEFIKKIYENLYNSENIFLMNEILIFLKKHPDILAINHHLVSKNEVH
jgi:spore coat polysaccharide biosynthesis protein SpsF